MSNKKTYKSLPEDASSMEAADLMAAFYGTGGVDTSPLALLAQIEEGIPVSMLHEVMEGFDLSLDEMATVLHINPRTIRRLGEAGTVLRADIGERVVFLRRLLVFATAVLGGRAALADYIRRPSFAFDGARPLDYLTTLYGIELVYDEVGRVEHGVY